MIAQMGPASLGNVYGVMSPEGNIRYTFSLQMSKKVVKEDEYIVLVPFKLGKTIKPGEDPESQLKALVNRTTHEVLFITNHNWLVDTFYDEAEHLAYEVDLFRQLAREIPK